MDYNNYFKEYINLFPSTNDMLDVKKYRHLRNQFENSISSNHRKFQKKLFNKYLKRKRTKKNKKISNIQQIFIYHLKSNLDYLNYDFHLIPLNHSDSIISHYCEMASGNSLYKFNTKLDYINFIKKTECFCKYLDQCIMNMEMGIKNKITIPKIIAKLLINQIKEIIKNKSYIKQTVPKNIQNYNEIIEYLILPKIKEILKFLTKNYYPHCTDKIGMINMNNGKKMYECLVRQHTTLNNIDIKYIHNYGIKEVDRIFKEMNKIKTVNNFQGTIKQFNEYLSKLNKYKFNSENEILKVYEKERDKIYNSIFKKKFNVKISHNYDIKSVPKFNQNFAPAAYYMPGDLEGNRLGTFFINTRDITNHSKMEVESLSLHEGIPGHHLQLTYLYDNNFPIFLKTIDFTAYEEGWALYSESLGNYEDPLSYYGKLNAEMMRAIRLIVDTGIHYYNWSFKKSFDLFKKFTFMKDSDIKAEIYRYIAIPGQALSYKIGEKVFLDLKNKKKLNEKSFHDLVLKNGPMPLSILKNI